MAHKVKLHLCLAVGSYFKHGGACSSSPSTFRTGIALYEAHSSAYYFLTAAVLPDQLEKFLIHKITRATFSTLFICKRIANKKIGLGVRGRTLNPFICWSLWYGCPNYIPASHAGALTARRWGHLKWLVHFFVGNN
jgi:hypothetical protein